MGCATFRFYGELNDFLPRRQRNVAIEHFFDWRASIKDMIESLGIPHCEIGLIVVNGVSVGFDAIVQPGDDVHVYPYFETVELPGRVQLREPLPENPGFVLDIHLGRLAAYLRMMGFDTLYGDTKQHSSFADRELAQIAHDEQRILLTRDVGLLKRSIVIYGRWVRNTRPRQQLAEVITHFNLIDQIVLFRRCLKCNGLLHPVEKEEVLDQLLPDTARYYNEFHRCQSCGQVYWQGSHFSRMQKIVDEVLR